MKRAALCLALVALLVGSGCTRNRYDSFKVVDFIDATTPLSHRFVYTVEEHGQELTVQGLVEDDFRYKMQLSSRGEPAVEQIVSDDAVAVRFLQTGFVEQYADKEILGQVDQKTDVPGAGVFDALRANRWVLDPVGAPPVIVTPPDKDDEDDVEATNDPIFDARTALAYVRAVAQSSYFARYEAESLEPTYRADEDPFPQPEEDSGVTRYDSIVFDFPAAAAATQGTESDFPRAVNFRKMAVYVKDGRIIEVREYIGLTPRTLVDFEEYLSALVEQTAPDDVRRSFEKNVRDLQDDREALGQFLLTGLNSYLDLAGRDPIRFRSMRLQLQDFEDSKISVKLPAGVIRGNLAVLRNLGRKPLAATEAGKAPSGLNTASGTSTGGGTTGSSVPAGAATDANANAPDGTGG